MNRIWNTTMHYLYIFVNIVKGLSTTKIWIEILPDSNLHHFRTIEQSSFAWMRLDKQAGIRDPFAGLCTRDSVQSSLWSILLHGALCMLKPILKCSVAKNFVGWVQPPTFHCLRSARGWRILQHLCWPTSLLELGSPSHNWCNIRTFQTKPTSAFFIRPNIKYTAE